jgi:predicted peroxiredoxin
VVTAVGLAAAAVKRGIEVEIFMMYDAVLNTVSDRLKELGQSGAKITLCTHNVDELKAHRNDDFNYGSQFDHSYIVNEAHRYVAFV